MASDLRIVDSHVHLWDLSRARYGWLQDDPLPNNPAGDMSPIANANYLLDDYLADTAGWRLDKIVHVEAGQPMGQQLAETDWLQSIADDTGYPHAIVAGADMLDPDLDALLEAHAARPNVRGVRQIVCWHEDPLKTYTTRDLLRDPKWVESFAKLARYGLSFDLQLYPAQMANVAIIAARHPDIPMIVNHAGLPTDRDAAGMERWRTGLRLLAAQPQVSIKISGLGITDRVWTPDSIRPVVWSASTPSEPSAPCSPPTSRWRASTEPSTPSIPPSMRSRPTSRSTNATACSPPTPRRSTVSDPSA